MTRLFPGWRREYWRVLLVLFSLKHALKLSTTNQHLSTEVIVVTVRDLVLVIMSPEKWCNIKYYCISIPCAFFYEVCLCIYPLSYQITMPDYCYFLKLIESRWFIFSLGYIMFIYTELLFIHKNCTHFERYNFTYSY